jgi:hypothetical protein
MPLTKGTSPSCVKRSTLQIFRSKRRHSDQCLTIKFFRKSRIISTQQLHPRLSKTLIHSPHPLQCVASVAEAVAHESVRPEDNQIQMLLHSSHLETKGTISLPKITAFGVILNIPYAIVAVVGTPSLKDGIRVKA